MNRRAFLKTLASFGVSIALPLDLTTATDAEIDAAWAEAKSTWDLFEVNEYGTLSHANFEEPDTRYKAYGISKNGLFEQFRQYNILFISLK